MNVAKLGTDATGKLRQGERQREIERDTPERQRDKEKQRDLRDRERIETLLLYSFMN